MNKLDIKKIKDFLLEDIWRVTEDEVSKKRGMFYNAIKIATLSVREFMQGRIVNKASALTYNTLLAIIPILAILFAIARGFGFANLLEAQFRSGMEGQAITAETVLNFIDSYLSHARSGVFIGVGLIMLFYTVLLLTYNMERTFNSIWQVKKPRSLYRKMTDYFSMLLLLPLLILLSSGISIFMSTIMKNMEEFVLLAPIIKFIVRLTPFVLTWGMFTALYIFMPNTKVKFKYAVFPGILAGTAFQAFQYLYIGSQIWVSRYNAIYGSFAAIPMFLLWTQISWSICLYGAQLCYVAQNLRNFSFSKETANISRRYHDFLCILIMSLICKRFQTEKEPYTAESLSDEHKLPIRLTTTILYELQDLHMIYETPVENDEEEVAYLPAVDINQMNVSMLLNRLDTAGSEAFKIDRNRYSAPWEALTQAREDYYDSTSKILLKDL
ncbi:MAG: YihY/virulence factor BrkB family protein [Bacteroidaceae bacterium]|nr:YihY/virulence factor BrkB family protein [Bacteroidaceae bacterium]